MMATTTTTVEIIIAPMTAAYVQEHNGGNPLTDAAAEVIANAYNVALDDRIADEYPDAAVTFQSLNGIDGFRVYADTDPEEDEIRLFLESATQAIWESPELWDLVEGCAYCSSSVCHASDETVPDVDDDDAWGALAVDHATDCEWITTRAHRAQP